MFRRLSHCGYHIQKYTFIVQVYKAELDIEFKFTFIMFHSPGVQNIILSRLYATKYNINDEHSVLWTLIARFYVAHLIIVGKAPSWIWSCCWLFSLLLLHITNPDNNIIASTYSTEYINSVVNIPFLFKAVSAPIYHFMQAWVNLTMNRLETWYFAIGDYLYIFHGRIFPHCRWDTSHIPPAEEPMCLNITWVQGIIYIPCRRNW